VRRALRLLLERLDDDGLDLVVADLARRAASRLVAQAIEAVLGEPLAPRAHGLARDADLGGDLAVFEPLGGGQDDLRSLRVAPRHLAAAGEALKIGSLVLTEHDRAGLLQPRHAAPRIAANRGNHAFQQAAIVGHCERDAEFTTPKTNARVSALAVRR
jgi:hypothetical protein